MVIRDAAHIDPSRRHGDDQIRAEGIPDEDVLHIINEVAGRRRFRLARGGEVAAARNVVSVIDLVSDGVRNHQIEVVDQFDGGVGVARRIGPDQGDAHRKLLGVGGKVKVPRARLAGGQGVRRALINEANGPGVFRLREEQRRQSVRQIYQAPTLIIDRAVDLEIVAGSNRAGAVNERGFHHRRTVRAAQGGGEPLLEELLNERQNARDKGRGHAGSGFVAIIWPQVAVQLGQQLKIGRIRRILVFQFPVLRTGGNYERAGGRHIRLETTKLSLQADAHIASARKLCDLVIAVRLVEIKCVRLQDPA